jgi:hypothetical protein
MDTAVSVELFVEILNRYVYYFDQQNEAVRHLAPNFFIDELMILGYDEIFEWPHRTDPF